MDLCGPGFRPPPPSHTQTNAAPPSRPTRTLQACLQAGSVQPQTGPKPQHPPSTDPSTPEADPIMFPTCFRLFLGSMGSGRKPLSTPIWEYGVGSGPTPYSQKKVENHYQIFPFF